MIDVLTNRIVRAGIDERIIRWEVWFRTPFGLCASLNEGVELLGKSDIDPRLCIVPVAVAICSSTHEVWERV